LPRYTSVLLSLLWLALSTSAQTAQPSVSDRHTQAGRDKISEATEGQKNPCKTLATMAPLVDGAFDGQKNETRMIRPLLTDPEDTTWDDLTDCANGTRKPAERSEALRVSAVWERLRAEAFQKLYRDSVPVSAPACTNLEKLYSIVSAAKDQSAALPPDSRGVAIRKDLIDCANDSYRLNQSRPRSQEADAAEYLSAWTEKNEDYIIARYNELAGDHNQLLAGANDLVEKYNALLGDYEKERSLALQAIHANDSYVHSMERMAFFQSMQAQPVNCAGTSYSYGKWGTFNVECH
jgi:hypothetical protein